MTQASAWLGRLTTYAESFASAFRRQDQARWMRVYLQGLLSPGTRKSIETMVPSLTLALRPTVDLAQALQHFVNQSPWDEQELWRQLRARFLSPGAGDGIFVIDDVGFAKQGSQSVGVQRQYWSERGKKVNCQLAVGLSWAGSQAVYPLGLRLYLPRSWVTDKPRLRAAGVPPRHQEGLSKARIALELIDEARGEGISPSAVVGPLSYGAAREFREGIFQRQLPYLLGVPGDAKVTPQPKALPVPARDCGRSSATGEPSAWDRVWVGPEWPGAAGPFGLLRVGGRDGRDEFALGNLPTDWPANKVAALWLRGRETQEMYALLRDELGLDHFEGRSWRGFHHHTALVVLAYCFRITQRQGSVKCSR